ncbi:cytochrome P450 monooxygenase, partial [Penicillium sp. IBT 16267x]
TLFLLRRDLLQHRSTKFTSIASKIPEESVLGSGDPGFGTYIRASNDYKSALSREEILSNSSFLIIAGSETTATFLSGCTFFILHKKLSFQIRDRFSSPTEMTFSISKYVIPALCPPIITAYVPTWNPWHAASCTKWRRCSFRATSVAVASWATYQSSSNFKDPQLFLPERWLDTDAGGDDVKGASQPFSAIRGGVGCAGKSLAFGEASLILARSIWAFDLELSPQCSNWADQRAYIIWDKGPLLVKLTPRS